MTERDLDTILDAAVQRFADEVELWSSSGDDRHLERAEKRAGLAFGLDALRPPEVARG